jgi:hypothetical protein
MCGSSLVTGSAKWGLEGGNGIYWVLPNGSKGGYLGPPPWDCAFLLGRKNGSWGQFHQLAYSKLLCVQMIWPLTSISPTKLCPTLRAHSTRSYPKFYAVHSMLCVSKISVNPWASARRARGGLEKSLRTPMRKSTGAKADHRTLMKLTPDPWVPSTSPGSQSMWHRRGCCGCFCGLSSGVGYPRKCFCCLKSVIEVTLKDI